MPGDLPNLTSGFMDALSNENKDAAKKLQQDYATFIKHFDRGIAVEGLQASKDIEKLRTLFITFV